MKKIYFKMALLIVGLSLHQMVTAQCAFTIVNGSATNMFTVIRNGNNPVAVDKSLNRIVFVNHTNVASFGGN
ncbi:MAG: hypothetical protein PSX36_16615 [bacterium]|nr:hypothetical protein [bacterium]